MSGHDGRGRVVALTPSGPDDAADLERILTTRLAARAPPGTRGSARTPLTPPRGAPTVRRVTTAPTRCLRVLRKMPLYAEDTTRGDLRP